MQYSTDRHVRYGNDCTINKSEHGIADGVEISKGTVMAMKNYMRASMAVLGCAIFLMSSLSVISVTDVSDGEAVNGVDVVFVDTPDELISSLKDQSAHITVVTSSMTLASLNVVIVYGNAQLVIGDYNGCDYAGCSGHVSVDLKIDYDTQLNINTNGRLIVSAGSSLTNYGTMMNYSGQLKEKSETVLMSDISGGSKSYDYSDYGVKVEGPTYIDDKKIDSGIMRNYGGDFRNYGLLYFAGDAEIGGGFYNYGAIIHSGNFNVYNTYLNMGQDIAVEPDEDDGHSAGMVIDRNANVVNDGSDATITLVDRRGSICMQVGDNAIISSATMSVTTPMDGKSSANIVLNDLTSKFTTGDGYFLSNLVVNTVGTENAIKMSNLISPTSSMSMSYGSLHISGSYENSGGSITVTSGAVNISGTLSAGTSLVASDGTEIKIDPAGLILEEGSEITIEGSATAPSGLPVGIVDSTGAGGYAVGEDGGIVRGHIVSFDAGAGGSDVASVVAVNGYRYCDIFVSGEMPDATKDGMRFIGWFTGPEDGSIVGVYDVIDLDSDVTLYAHFTEETETQWGIIAAVVVILFVAAAFVLRK